MQNSLVFLSLILLSVLKIWGDLLGDHHFPRRYYLVVILASRTPWKSCSFLPSERNPPQLHQTGLKDNKVDRLQIK